MTADVFRTKLIETSEFEPDEIAYVGDRLDNDIRPAIEAGLVTVFIKRGPWATSTPAAPRSNSPTFRSTT